MNSISKEKNDYLQLRQKLDQEILRLEKKHKKHLACKKGCDLCCLNFSVFPIEFEVIREETRGAYNPLLAAPESESENSGSCAFLSNHACTIYESRPFICRTHGLALLYVNDDDWELSHCELNFTEAPEDYFDEKNTFAQDKWNSKLFMLNREYLQSSNELKLEETDLIPLYHLDLTE
jgi:Fe-S-cluster containining protein